MKFQTDQIPIQMLRAMKRRKRKRNNKSIRKNMEGQKRVRLIAKKLLRSRVKIMSLRRRKLRRRVFAIT